MKGRTLARNTTRWTIIGFTLKGTCTLSIMAWTAFSAWSGRDAAARGFPWHGPLLVLGTFAIGVLCVKRHLRRKRLTLAQAGTESAAGLGEREHQGF